MLASPSIERGGSTTPDRTDRIAVCPSRARGPGNGGSRRWPAAPSRPLAKPRRHGSRREHRNEAAIPMMDAHAAGQLADGRSRVDRRLAPRTEPRQERHHLDGAGERHGSEHELPYGQWLIVCEAQEFHRLQRGEEARRYGRLAIIKALYNILLFRENPRLCRGTGSV